MSGTPVTPPGRSRIRKGGGAARDSYSSIKTAAAQRRAKTSACDCCKRVALEHARTLATSEDSSRTARERGNAYTAAKGIASLLGNCCGAHGLALVSPTV
jgi:hypothetical protein